jgi:hypothetical protein
VSDDPVRQAPAGPGQRAPDDLEALTAEILPALVARLRASRLGELEVRSGAWRVRLRRDPAASARPAVAAAAGRPSEAEAE